MSKKTVAIIGIVILAGIIGFSTLKNYVHIGLPSTSSTQTTQTTTPTTQAPTIFDIIADINMEITTMKEDANAEDMALNARLDEMQVALDAIKAKLGIK